ncbi:hypothetical protein QJS10_CPB19g00450 [Acorus calamus]|uniref:DUF1279 domain-containing protein n=1 Tax=Acorus calamus TaxID=4465 RepID=A0AAV9CDV5_ACOCL|nr:hypothetical protein QJS10_CPB19g00450 [Acorus calamus]
MASASLLRAPLNRLTSPPLLRVKPHHLPTRTPTTIRAVQEKTKEPPTVRSTSSSSPEEVTKKLGLEFGLWKVGIQTDAAGQKVGTFALAYAAHKAASPIRFPPTVALTPIVAGWIGKKKIGGDQDDK